MDKHFSKNSRMDEIKSVHVVRFLSASRPHLLDKAVIGIQVKTDTLSQDLYMDEIFL